MVPTEAHIPSLNNAQQYTRGDTNTNTPCFANAIIGNRGSSGTYNMVVQGCHCFQAQVSEQLGAARAEDKAEYD
jgi:hypothetical protein